MSLLSGISASLVLYKDGTGQKSIIRIDTRITYDLISACGLEESKVNNDNTCYHDPLDEILESVWMLTEAGETRSASRIIETSHTGSADRRHIDRLVEHGYLSSAGEDTYEFTEKGEDRAKGIIRRHRLAERLLVDVLNVRENAAIESDACAFEHFLSPEVTDHICTLLGHPTKCPHGYDIPRGKCCERAQKQIETAVVRLAELSSGESGRVVYIATTDHHRLDRLTSLGLFPGRVVKVHQKEPLLILILGETQLALEKRLVEDVHVVRS
jgi:DtxR family Mn-dependent transcriptional regulator